METRGLLSFAQACDYLGIRRSKLYALIADGELRSVHIGARHLLPFQECERFVERLVEAQAPEAEG